jgi:O-antigen/teichoic acid export membrane protein
MVGGAASGIYMCTSVLFFFHGQTTRLASVTLSAGLIGAPLTWWLVGSFGATGAAAGYAAMQSVLALLTTIVAIRTFALPWRDIRAAVTAWRQSLFARRKTVPDVDNLK